MQMQKSINCVTHFTLVVLCTLSAPMVPLARYKFVATSGYVFDQSWGGRCIFGECIWTVTMQLLQ